MAYLPCTKIPAQITTKHTPFKTTSHFPRRATVEIKTDSEATVSCTLLDSIQQQYLHCHQYSNYRCVTPPDPLMAKRWLEALHSNKVWNVETDRILARIWKLSMGWAGYSAQPLQATEDLSPGNSIDPSCELMCVLEAWLVINMRLHGHILLFLII